MGLKKGLFLVVKEGDKNDEETKKLNNLVEKYGRDADYRFGLSVVFYNLLTANDQMKSYKNLIETLKGKG